MIVTGQKDSVGHAKPVPVPPAPKPRVADHKPRQIPKIKPKFLKVEVGTALGKDDVARLLAEGYTHFEFPDGTKPYIVKLTGPAVAMRLEWNIAFLQYVWVPIHEPGWTPSTKTPK